MMMGMSLEGLRAFAKRVPSEDCTILECGAGVSTWMLRQAFPNVTTIDSNEKWLADVIGLCKSNGCDVPLGTVQIGFDGVQQHDCVLFDYELMPARPKYIATAWGLAKQMMYLDDADDRTNFLEYYQEVNRFALKHRIKAEECRDATDRYKRYGICFTR